MTSDMRAVLVAALGEAPTIGTKPVPVLGTVPIPGFPIEGPLVPPRAPGPHPASLVEVEYASINPIDLHVASGHFFQGTPQVPYVPGVEGVGRSVESESLPAGTRVRFELGHPGYGADGAMAELAAVDDAGLVELSGSMSGPEAAALGVSFVTAARALDLAEVAEGETVLVLGASGAIGKIAVQLARHAGAGRVIAAGRRRDRLERAMELGADACVSIQGKSTDELTAEFREAGGGGVDVVIDPIWGEPAVAALAASNFGGRLVNFGQAGGSIATVSSLPLRNHRATIKGISTAMDGFELRRSRYLNGLELLAQGKLVVDHRVFAIDDIAEAWTVQQESPGVRLVVKIR